MKATQKQWFWTFTIVTFVLSSLIQAQENVNTDHKIEPTKLIESVPAPVYWLLQWPDSSVLKGPNRVSHAAVEVTWPEKQCSGWLQKVLATGWLPSPGAEMIFIRDEFDGRDTVRIAWERNGYIIQVSQTASVFAMKLTPLGNRNTGADSREKTQNAKLLCAQVFAKEGYRWGSGAGTKVQIKGLSEKIASYSFRPELVRHLKDDKAVCGRPQTMNEAGVKQPQNDVEALRERDPNNPNWDKTASSYSYWFRMVNWWNDGKSIGFYFLKVEEGAWIPSYCGDIDKNFFKK
jgi:hypothetical protein